MLSHAVAVDPQQLLVQAFLEAADRPTAPEYLDHVGRLRLPGDPDFDAAASQVSVIAGGGRTIEHGIILDTTATITTYAPTLDKAWGLAQWADLVVRSSSSLVHEIAFAETSGIRLVETPPGDHSFCYSFTADIRIKSGRLAVI